MDVTTWRAKKLRRSMTDAEKILWFNLRSRRLCGFKFRRQVPIGPYIADFVCNERKLVIELDGGQHAEQRQYDVSRTRFLNEKGYLVLRFWNHDVITDREMVLENIYRVLNDRETA